MLHTHACTFVVVFTYIYETNILNVYTYNNTGVKVIVVINLVLPISL